MDTKYDTHFLPGLAFVVYWGVLLFGYDTYAIFTFVFVLSNWPPIFFSGIAGGVVSQDYFKRHFGLVNEDNTINIHRSTEVSSNVVSVLQGGAFFGALSSAQVSCKSPPVMHEWRFSSMVITAKLGRRMTLVVFTLFFTVGAVCKHNSYVSNLLNYTDRF